MPLFKRLGQKNDQLQRFAPVTQALHIEALAEDQSAEAVQVFARAYLSNPLHLAIFGGDQERALRSNQAFFRVGLELLRGGKWVAVAQGQIVGVVHWVNSPGCRASLAHKIVVAGRLMFAVGAATPRLGRWLYAWERRDPEVPHCHLGPIAVLPQFQCRGIGTQLMQTYCAHVDRQNWVGYLETDRPENVPFYEKFGFSVSEELPVLGVPTWLMCRRPNWPIDT